MTVHAVVCLPGDQDEHWLQCFDAGSLDDELLRVALTRPSRPLRSAPRSVRRDIRDRVPRMIKHEFEVRLDQVPIDFRRLLPNLLAGHVRAYPADALATRLPWGVVTADGSEAEIATAPVPIEPGFVRRAVEAAATGLSELRAACPDDDDLIGFSTHISVSWEPRRDDRCAQTWARIFAPALMLLLDRPTSPGLLVRPRPGRLELCGDYCTGNQLAAAIARNVPGTDFEPSSTSAVAAKVLPSSTSSIPTSVTIAKTEIISTTPPSLLNPCTSPPPQPPPALK